MRLQKRTVSAGVLAAITTCFALEHGSAQYANRAAAFRNSRGVAGVTSAHGARQVTGSASLSGVRMGMSAFAADMGRMPTTSEGLMALIVRPPGARNWRGPYISTTNAKAPFADPWGMQYRYTQQVAGRSYIYTIASNGPDRVAGTRDDLQVQF